MSNSLNTASSDPFGSETLGNMGEAEGFNKWMYSAISPYLHGKILEIGSGLGNISGFLLEDKQDVTLSDLRPEYCNYLSKHFKECKSLDRVVRIDIAEKDFDTAYGHLLGTFNSLFALNVIEHIEDDSIALQNCKKLLKEQGSIIILVPSYQWLYCRFDRELGHLRRYSRQSLRSLAKVSGFEVNNLFSFNAAGLAGWFLFGKLLNNRQIKEGQMKLFDNFVFLFRFIDTILFHKSGLSLILIARK
jgi:2-polyprenyl-3-methyl-5-hydroxy-6-metoxy-1,4-benzoquinol methylase